jgi:hypothetical protein
MKKLIIFSLVLAFFACEKTTIDNNSVVMTYQMTQCADPWMTNANYSNDKEGTLKKFLIEKGVKVISLSIKTDCGNSAVCQACICQGCDNATVTVPQEDVADMEALKFKKQ